MDYIKFEDKYMCEHEHHHEEEESEKLKKIRIIIAFLIFIINKKRYLKNKTEAVI